MDRRQFLAGAGVTVTGVLAGCPADRTDTEEKATTGSVPEDVAGSVTGFQGGPNHRGRVEGPGPTGDLGDDWSAARDSVETGYNAGTPLLTDGTVYFAEGTMQGEDRANATLRALDAVSGTEQWRHTVDGTNVVGGTTVDAGTVVAAFSGRLVGLNTDDGTERWRRSLHVQRPPVSNGGTVYVVTASIEETTLRALAADSGETLWERPVRGGPAAGRAAPAVDGDAVYLAGDGLQALSATDGSERWSVTLDEQPASTPTVDGDTVYVGTRANGVAAVSTGERRQRWWTQVEDASYRGVSERTVPASPAVADGTVVAVSSWAGTGVDAATGEKQWGGEIGVSGAPMVDGETAYATGVERLVALSLTDGAEVGSFSTDAESGSGTRTPAVADGVVYAPLDGLYALT